MTREERKGVADERWAQMHEQRVGRQIITHSMRANDSKYVEQGVGWATRVRQARARNVETRETMEAERGCAVCGVCQCNLAHVVLAQCTGVHEAGPYLQRVEASLQEVLAVLPRVQDKALCPCRIQVQQAIAVVRRARVHRRNSSCCTHESFAAVRRVLGGNVAESMMSAGMEEREK